MQQPQTWIRQQLICCFIHAYLQTYHLPPTLGEIGAWVGCPGNRSLHLALAQLEQHQYLSRQPGRRRTIALTAKGIALAQRWQLLVVGDTGLHPLHLPEAAT